MYNMMDFRESNPGLPIHRLTCYPLGHATPTHPPNLYILIYILNMHNQAKIKTTDYMIRKTSVFSNLHYKLINLNRLGTIDFTVQQVRYDRFHSSVICRGIRSGTIHFTAGSVIFRGTVNLRTCRGAGIPA
jgi:hypothetical protein